MADKKITAYVALPGASVASGDLFEIVDVSEALNADKNKYIAASELKIYIGDWTLGTLAGFNSLGIDDNATSEKVDLTDSLLLVTPDIRTLGSLYVGNAVLTTDDQFYMAGLNATYPGINFDSNDYFSYSRGTDTWEMSIAGSAILTLSTAQLFLSSNIWSLEYIRSDKEVYAGNSTLTTDDTFFLGAFSATQPKINWDSNDFLGYDRTTNKYKFFIASTIYVTIDATEGLATDKISEQTATVGVTIDGVLLKDSAVTARNVLSTPTLKTADYTLIAQDYILINSGGVARTMTLPATLVAGDQVVIHHFNTNATPVLVTVARNGKTIRYRGDTNGYAGGAADDITLADGETIQLIASDTSNWEIV